MMNPFTTIPGLISVIHAIRKFTSHAPELEALREKEDYEGERALILQNSIIFADNVSRKLKVTYDIQGEENMPESGPVLIVANHQSYADILAMYYAFRKFQIGFIAKSEFRNLKILNDGIKYTRSIYIERNNPKEALRTLRVATEMLQEGFSLVIFPEGTRSKDGEMAEFKAGSFKFAQKAGVPILPVTLDGGYHLFEEKGSLHPALIHIRIHPLVHFEKMSRKEQNEAHILVEQIIRDGLNEIRSEN